MNGKVVADCGVSASDVLAGSDSPVVELSVDAPPPSAAGRRCEDAVNALFALQGDVERFASVSLAVDDQDLLEGFSGSAY